MKVLVWDWYDGPVGGLLNTGNNCWNYFYLLDWDLEHRFRIFGLQETSVNLDTALEELTTESPQWPVWMPRNLINSTDVSRKWVEDQKRQVKSPDRNNFLLVWDNELNKCERLVKVVPEFATLTETWFDAVEDHKIVDWFAVIALSKEAR